MILIKYISVFITILLTLMLSVNTSFSRENIIVKKGENIKLWNTELLILKAPNAKFNTLLMSVDVSKIKLNPNIKNEQEKVFQVLIDTFGFLFKSYNFQNDVSLGFVTENNIFGNMLLFLDEKVLNKVSLRPFNDTEFSRLVKGDVIAPPLLPLRELFNEAQIFITKKTDNGMSVIYSKEATKKFQKYVKKHIFQDWYAETKIEEVYAEYLQLKGSIFDCSGALNDIKCVQKYIKYSYDINAQDSKFDQTPLMYATANGNLDIVKLLIHKGADPNLYPSGMENAYLAAVRKGYTEIATLLEPITKVTMRASQNLLANPSDLKNMCFAISGENKDACYNINDSDLKNSCLGMTDYPTNCNMIADVDWKNFCLGASGQYPSFCYSIKNTDIKNACLGMTSYPTNCYNINDNNMKNMCLAVSGKYKDDCYQIK